MRLYLAVMAGGALGSLLRFVLASSIDTRTNSIFPWGTVTVNIIGCFVIGLFTALVLPVGGGDPRYLVSPTVRTFVTIGILGGFTTFSSFSLQSLTLALAGEWAWAAANVLGSVILCLTATFVGIVLANYLNLRA